MATAAPCGRRLPLPNIIPPSSSAHSSASLRAAICPSCSAVVFRNGSVSSSGAVAFPFSSEIQRQPSKAWRTRKKCGVAVVAVERQQAPLRDRVVDFGKFKGAKMGTLSCRYLKWMVNNLKSGPWSEWSAYAEEVLADPYYRDRLEWEKVEKMMAAGHDVRSRTGSRDAVLAPAKMFGWDLQDEVGWRKVNFSLLGTTKGGRIPRVNGGLPLVVPEKKRPAPRKKDLVSIRASMATASILSASSSSTDDDVSSSGSLRDKLMRRRAQRRDRLKEGLLLGNDRTSNASTVLSNKFPGRENLLKTVRSYDISE